MIDLAERLVPGLLPVLLFLGVLVYLDSYKLVRARGIALVLAAGALGAALVLPVHWTVAPLIGMKFATYSRYVSPIGEELVKAIVVVWLVRTHRVGFLVDAAIYGFAVGTGFALAENAYYARLLAHAPFGVWVVRGFGTAVMHGGATAICAIAGKAMMDQGRLPLGVRWLPGLAVAVVLHSAFNHFFLHPVVSAIGILLVLPPLVFVVFRRSEGALRDWLHVSFDADVELLELIHSGQFSESRIGQYLTSLREHFRGEVVADLLCYLRLHVELSLRAKGLLLMRQAGFRIEPDTEVREKFDELEYLERSIGLTGKLAMAPFLRASSKELWQLRALSR